MHLPAPLVRAQRGFGFTHIFFGLGFFVLAFWLGMKIVPPLWLHKSVQEQLDSIAADPAVTADPTESKIRSAFERRLDTAYLEGKVTPDDLVIERTEDGLAITVLIDKESEISPGIGIHVVREATATLPN